MSVLPTTWKCHMNLQLILKRKDFPNPRVIQFTKGGVVDADLDHAIIADYVRLKTTQRLSLVLVQQNRKVNNEAKSDNLMVFIA